MFLEKMDSQNILQQNWLQEIKEDPKIKEFLGEVDAKIYIENSYFLKDEKQNAYLGFITHSDPVDTKVGKTISIYYAVHPNYRHQGYGSVLLNLFTEEILSLYPIDKFVLNIKKENQASQKLAMKCGFQCILEDDEDMLFIKEVTKKKTL